MAAPQPLKDLVGWSCKQSSRFCNIVKDLNKVVYSSSHEPMNLAKLDQNRARGHSHRHKDSRVVRCWLPLVFANWEVVVFPAHGVTWHADVLP